MKTLLKNPIAGMFGKKTDDNGAKEKGNEKDGVAGAENEKKEMDDRTLGLNHYKLFKSVSDVKGKLKKLEGAKEQITEDRYQSLFEQYNGILKNNFPSLKQYREEVDRRISVYIQKKKEVANRFAEIKKLVAQEAKLLEDGLISKEDYVEKTKHMKPEEKGCAESYKNLKKQILLLKKVKENKYIPELERIEKPPVAAPSQSTATAPGTGGGEPPPADLGTKDEVFYGKEVVIKLEPGTALDVKMEEISIPVTCNFVGVDQHEYLLIAPPSPYNTVKGKLNPGNQLEFHCIFKGRKYQFSSKIIKHLTKPIRVVVLEYPEKLDVKDLRTTLRVTCRIPATLFYRGKGKESIIKDMSAKGCGLKVIYEPSEKNYIARNGDEVKLECAFHGSSERYQMNGIVRNVKKKQLSLTYGIQFTVLDEEVQTVILNYVSLSKA